MATRDEIRIAVQGKLTWIVTGSGSDPRPEAEMRAIIDWIDGAVDAWLLDPGGEGAMLQALLDGLFTIASIDGGEPTFQLTDYGRARVDSMPHDVERFTRHGISGIGDGT